MHVYKGRFCCRMQVYTEKQYTGSPRNCKEFMMKLEHVALNVAEPGLMAVWYAENLGMEIVLGLIEPPYTHFLADSERSSMLEFYHNPVAAVPDYAAMHPVMLHMAFSVEDMQDARSK